MTLDGYCFTATGISQYAFFHEDKEQVCVSHVVLPDAPVRIVCASGAEYTLSPSGVQSAWESPGTGAFFSVLDDQGGEAGFLYVLSEDHFAVSIPGDALTGRIVRDRLRRSVCFTGLDDVLVARLECRFARMPSRECFGEWFPRRYVAEVMKHTHESLLAFALAVPFLGFDGIEIT